MFEKKLYKSDTADAMPIAKKESVIADMGLSDISAPGTCHQYS